MAERTRFSARATNAIPIIGLGILVAAMLPLLQGGFWIVLGPVIGVAIIVVQLRRPKGTVLIVEKQGLQDRRLGVAMIPWRYVDSIDRVNLRGTMYVNVNLNRLGTEFVELPMWRRAFTPVLAVFGIRPIHVVASGLDAPASDVYASIFAAYTLASQPIEKLVIKPKA